MFRIVGREKGFHKEIERGKEMTRRKLWGLVLVGLLALLLSACGASPTPETVVVRETVVVEQQVTRVVEVETEAEVTRVVEVEKVLVVTATPNPPPPAPEPTVLFRDDFEAEDFAWDPGDGEGVGRFYEGGQFRVLVKTPMTLAWAGHPGLQTMDNFTLEVAATQVDGPDDNEYGVLFRYQDPDNWYAFLISGDGYFKLCGQFAGEDWSIVNWTQAAAIRQGQSTNHLRLVADGSQISAYVNGELLAIVPDNTFRRGDINLVVGAFEDGGVHVAFDDLKVTALD